MNFHRTLKNSLYVFASVTLLALASWAFIEGRHELASERERERPVKEPSRVRNEEGRIEISLDVAEQEEAGILTSTIPVTSHQSQVKVYATVVPIQQIADAYQGYASQKAQATKAIATASASQKEFLRIKDLYGKRLESDKNLQAAEADWQSDDASATAAQSALQSLAGSIRQEWGKPIALWFFKGSTELDRLLNQEIVLIEATLSADQFQPGRTSIPRVAFAQLSPADPFIHLHYVSSAQAADARFQGTVLYFSTDSQSSALLGGMNVSVFLPTGDTIQGLTIPRSAAVWWQGKAWFYAREDSTTFTRLELPTSEPTESGWFLQTGSPDLPVPAKIVTRGAQLLLSEEFRSQIQVGEEGEEKSE